jgi:hypothetical protein
MKDTLSIKPTTTLWLLIFLSFFPSPLLPSSKAIGFHSVEVGFFVVIAIFGWLTVLLFLLKASYLIRMDKVMYWCIFFLIICVLSTIDAQNKLRAALFTGQYLPYFFLFYITINSINEEYQLDKVVAALTHIAFGFSVIVFVAALWFNDRGKLDNFLLDNFVIESTKVLMYIELTVSVLVYRVFHSNLTKYEFLVLIMSVLATLASGGRTNIGVMAIIFGLSFLRSKALIKKSLIIVCVLICAGFMIFSVDYLKQRLQLMVITGTQDYQNKIVAFSRVYTSEIALEVIQRFPINGTGIGNLSYYTENILKGMKGLPQQILIYWNETNKAKGRTAPFETTVTPLKFTAELGPLGLVFFLGFYYYLWRRITNAIKATSGNFKITLSGLRIFIVASFIHNLLDPGITNYYSWFFYGLVIAGTRIACIKHNCSKYLRTTHDGRPSQLAVINI